MIILGLTHPISWNNAACVLVDGQLVAMAEEERFNRIKHSPRMPAQKAMEYCLREAGVSLDQVDYVAIGFDSALRAARGNINWREPLSSLNQAAFWLKEGQVYERLLPLDDIDKDKIIFVSHHMSHAASAYYASGFEDANIISLDGSGGTESGILAYGEEGEIHTLETVSNRGSWGLLYESITEKLGFRRHSGEGKTMGLAAYGTPDAEGLPVINWDVSIPSIDPKRRKAFVSSLTTRGAEEPILQAHKDLAATLQDSLERAALTMADWLHSHSGSSRICLAGGTALNCSMNGRLAQLPWLSEIFVQPAAHDSGSALGAALYVHRQVTGQRPNWVMKHVYWGPEYDNESIESALKSFTGINYHRSDDVTSETAELLAGDRIVGWFQGRLEIGPRALGNRSILANPSNPAMKDLVNMKVKHREPWRPFAPSILEEKISRYVDTKHPSPYMILAFDCKQEVRDEIISAIHIDGTCRPQTVNRETNPRYWQLIKEFEARTSIPAVLNTSFNVNKQPIVNTPHEAIDTFINCGMEALAIGDFIVLKESLR